jgi:hypothetical protein
VTARKENALREQGADTTNHYTAKNTAPRTLKQRAKALIVTAAVWGCIPPGFATWLIQRGGLRHE